MGNFSSWSEGENQTEAGSSQPYPIRKQPSRVFIPLLLVTLAVTGWFGFQTVQLLKERSSLRQAESAQEPQIQQSMKVRSALDGLARDTAQLAERGNPNAKLLVEELRKRDIVINPNFPPPLQSPQK
jgi:hypothetical protein